MWTEIQLKEHIDEWIPCVKGSFPEDVLPKKYWKPLFGGGLVQSFPVLFKNNGVTGFGIRHQFKDGTFDWDNHSKSYAFWKLRKDMWL